MALRVAHICTYPDGGAGIAARRLHQALPAQGVDSRFLSLGQPRSSFDGGQVYAHQPTVSDRLSHRLNPSRWAKVARAKAALIPGYDWFSAPDSILRPENASALADVDIVHLHWVADFINWPSFWPRLKRRRQIVVWTLHDQNAFTGGCHYAGPCRQYEKACRSCPQLRGNEGMLVSGFFEERRRALSYGPAAIVTPSRWLGECARRSSLLTTFSRQVIPYGLPTDIYKPLPEHKRTQLRASLGISEEEKVLLFVADDLANQRKGYARLLASLPHLPSMLGGTKLVCITVGRGETPQDISNQVRTISVGSIAEPVRMAELYSLADLFVIASLEDNFPNTILEAHCSGTPVAGYAATGIAEMIESGINGYLAPPSPISEQPLALAQAITATLLNINSTSSRAAVSAQAHERYPLHLQAERYTALYQSVAEKAFAY
jgi:glycosyltransferase involved in cell wall biosynthesis